MPRGSHPWVGGRDYLPNADGEARFWLPLALLALPTVLLSLWVVIGRGFNGLYGQDPYTYYGYGIGPLRAFLLSGKSLTPMFWPLGYHFLVSLPSFVLGAVPMAGQIVRLIAGPAAVPLTYLLAHELLSQTGAMQGLARRAGLIGAMLMGVSGWLVQSSVTIMADSVALSAALLSAWALPRWSRHGHGLSSAGWLGLAGGALAWEDELELLELLPQAATVPELPGSVASPRPGPRRRRHTWIRGPPTPLTERGSEGASCTGPRLRRGG